MRLLLAHSLLAALLLPACAGHPADAADGPIVMVVGIDHDPDSVARTNRINREPQLCEDYPDPGDGTYRECQLRRAAGGV